MTPALNKQLYGLLNITGLIKQKKALVASYTSGRSESTKDLTDKEARELIAYLNNNATKKHAEGSKMRRNILAMAHEMHWELENGKVDMARVNRWCREYGYKKKDLNDYTYSELPKLVSQFKQVYNSFLKSL